MQTKYPLSFNFENNMKMNKTIIYGIVINNKFYSNDMEVPLRIENGFYSIDVSSDEYLDSIQPADMIEFEKYVRFHHDKMFFANGYTFKNSFIPMDFLWYQSQGFKIPIRVIDSTAEDWTLIKVLVIPSKNIFYFYGEQFNIGFNLIDTLLYVKDYYLSRTPLTRLYGVTPEMKLLYSFHRLEQLRLEEVLKNAKLAEYRKTLQGRVEHIIEDADGKFIKIEAYSKGYNVIWKSGSYEINTFMDENFSILEAGFCISGHDRKHTLTSITQLVGEYLKDGESLNITRE